MATRSRGGHGNGSACSATNTMAMMENPTNEPNRNRLTRISTLNPNGFTMDYLGWNPMGFIGPAAIHDSRFNLVRMLGYPERWQGKVQHHRDMDVSELAELFRPERHGMTNNPSRT